ncbi:MAG: hypothetical protein QM755_03920 [Luteolibacter sp.]
MSSASEESQPAAFDPPEVYFQGYLTARDAQTLEAHHDLAGALQKLKKSKEMFDEIVSKRPDWKPDLVKYRLEITSKEIERLESTVASQNSR